MDEWLFEDEPGVTRYQVTDELPASLGEEMGYEVDEGLTEPSRPMEHGHQGIWYRSGGNIIIEGV